MGLRTKEEMDVIKKFMKEHGYSSMAEFGRAVGMDRKNVYERVKGSCNPCIRTMLKWAGIIPCDVMELIELFYTEEYREHIEKIMNYATYLSKNGFKEIDKKMKVLAEMPTGMGSKWFLAEFNANFYGYGTVADFNDPYGLPVDQCGTKKEVKNHCKSIEKLCIKRIKEYQENFVKTKANEWKIMIEHEQKELDMLRKFIKVLTD